MINKNDIVLAHDSFTQLGGAEKVVDALHELFPNSPVYTLVISKKLKDHYKNWEIKTSWLQKFYNLFPNFQYFLPLIPFAAESVVVKDAQIILSSSSGFIKGLKKPKNSIHINYCHTPTRFLWSDSNYVDQEVPLILKPLVKIFLKWMRHWDLKVSKKIDFFIANSREVSGRIKKYYFRDSQVIYPPIDTNFWKPTITKEDYFLVAGRLQAHKKNDLIIEIFNELGISLHIVGTGRQESYLKSIAKSNIKFLGRISDKELRDQYSGAKALIYPQIEDAGLMPLEAASCGTATIGISKGGSLETIVPGITGELFDSYNKENIKNIILSWQTTKYQESTLIQHALKFSKEVFYQQILNYIESVKKQ